MFGNFQVNIKCSSFFHSKIVVCSVWSKNLRLYVQRIQQRSFSSRRVHKNVSRFCNKGIQILVTLFLELKILYREPYIISLLKLKISVSNYGDHGSSHSERFYKKGFVKIFAKATGKHFCWGPFFKMTKRGKKERFQHRSFLVSFAKFTRTLILKNACGQLLWWQNYAEEFCYS